MRISSVSTQTTKTLRSSPTNSIQRIHKTLQSDLKDARPAIRPDYPLGCVGRRSCPSFAPPSGNHGVPSPAAAELLYVLWFPPKLHFYFDWNWNTEVGLVWVFDWLKNSSGISLFVIDKLVDQYPSVGIFCVLMIHVLLLFCWFVHACCLIICICGTFFCVAKVLASMSLSVGSQKLVNLLQL